MEDTITGNGVNVRMSWLNEPVVMRIKDYCGSVLEGLRHKNFLALKLSNSV